MIWTRQNKQGNILFYTSDGNGFDKISDAVAHIRDNTERLYQLTSYFQRNIDRIDKLGVITKIMNN